MLDWNRWLPGLGSDEPEEEESAVTKALRALGQVPDALGGIGRSAGQSVVGAVQGAYAVPEEQRPPQYSGPSYAQPSLAPGQPSMLEQLPEVGQAGVSRAAETLQDRGALLSGLRRPETALEIAEQAAPAPARAVQIASETGAAFGAGAGRRFAEGTVRPDEDPNAPLFTTPQVGPIPAYPVTRGDVGAAVGTVLGDPTTYLGFGAAGRAADAPVDAAMRAAGRGIRGAVGTAGRAVGEVFEGNAARTAAADARMAAEGSTAAPGVFGALPEPGPSRRGLPTVEVLSEQLDEARAAVRSARESGEGAAEEAASDRMWALEDQLADAINHRRDLEPAITSDIGRRVESLPLAEETADTLSGAGSRLERARPSDFGTPMSPEPPSVSLNAALGMLPDQGGAAAARRADEIAAAGGPASSVKKWQYLANAGVDTKEELADTLRTVPMVTAAQARKLLGDRPDYLEPVAEFLLTQRRKALSGRMTARDVGKAYYMTLMSMRSAAQNAGDLQAKYGRGFVTGAGEAVPANGQLADLDGLVNVHNGKPLGPIFTEDAADGTRLVRPESAGAAWLWTDDGQRALNGLSEGEFIPDAWEGGRHARLAFGSDTVGGNGALRPLTAAEIRQGKVNMTNLPGFVDELNAGIAQMQRDGRTAEIGPWLTDQAKRLMGIATGKSAFIKQLLGFGDSVTIDAREINYWLSGKGLLAKGDTSRGAQLARASGQWWDSDVVSGALQPRIQQEVMRLRNAYPELLEGIEPEDAAHILHHWIWDKAGSSATRHTDVMASQQLAASAGAAPSTPGTGALPAVNRALSEGIAGGVGGAVIEQGRNPDEDPRTAAARGFAAGAVGFPLATRGARGLARLAGAAPSPGGGALATLGAVPEEAARSRLGAVAQRVMDTYTALTPKRVEAVTAKGIDVATAAIAKRARPGAMPVPAAELVPQIHAAVVRNLDDTKVVMTGLNYGALRAFLRGEGLTSKAETGSLDLINEITTGQVNVAGGRQELVDSKMKKVPFTIKEGADFTQRESEQMRAVTGGSRFPDPETGAIDAEAPKVLYAYVSEGQPLVAPNRPTLGLVWKPETPRVSSVGHPFGLLSPNLAMHKGMAPGGQELIYAEEAVRGGRRAPATMEGGRLVEAAAGVPSSGDLRFAWEQGGIDVGGGRKLVDTDYLVGPEGESSLRATSLVSGMSIPIQEAIARGQMTDPEQIAAVLMRGGSPQWKPGWGSVMNPTRTESLVLDPHLANVQAIYISGTPKNLASMLEGAKTGGVLGGKGERLAELEMARRMRAAIKAQTNNDVPIIFNDTTRTAASAGQLAKGASNADWAPRLISDAQVLEGPPLTLSPGRGRVVDQYTQAIDPNTGEPYMNIGGGVNASAARGLRPDLYNAAQGGVFGAASEDLQAQQEGREADPAERARRALIGGGLAVAGGRYARGGAGPQLGAGFVGRPANQAAAAAPNPMMQRMAQQMAGQYQPSAVTNKRGLGERWAQAMTDDRAGLRHFQESVSRSLGRPLSASESVAELTRVNPASVASQRIDEGIKGALQSVGEDEDYLSMYLVHSHNVDVAREIGQRAYDAAITAGRTPQQASQAATRAANTRQFSGDLRLGETLQQLTDIEQRVKSLPDGAARWQAIQDGAQQIWDFNKQTLERKRDAGIISDQLFNDLTTKYPKYVRTDIADYFDKGTGGPAPAGKRLGVSDIGIQKISAAGTAKERVNPLLSTIDQTYASEAAIARNEAGKAFEELIRLDPAWQSTFKEVVPAQGVNIGNPATSVPASYTLKNGEQFLRVWDRGQARTYVIPKEYAALVSPQTGRVLGDSGAAKAATEAMNIYKSLITSKNPAFSMVVSPLRDAGDYAIREATLSAKDQGIKGAMQAIGSVPGVMADYAKAIPDAFAGILEGTYKGDLGRMMSEGAGQISRPGRDQGELRAALGELQRTNGLEVKSAKDAMRLVGNVLTLGAGPIGGRIEQIPRLAAARRAGRRGASDLGQAMSFRDATVDFQRAGEWSRVINSVVPFFNVAMQGGAQTVRTFKANPAAFMASVAGTVGTATIAAEAWNNADPQRAADYEDVPDYLKRTGLVVMLPGVEGQSARGDALPNYVWIPVGQYGALVQTAKEAAKNAVAGKPGADLSSPAGWLELGAEVAGIFSPIRGESAGGMISSLIPPGLSTATEISANRDLFRGSTIATERRNEQASALSQASAAGFNTLTGQETQSSQWEYLYKDLGGYGATLALEASNLAAEKLGMRPPKADERPIQDIPIVGGLVNRVIRDAGGQRLEDATEDISRVPESIRPILAEVGLRRDQLAPVGSRYRGATLSREEQERWQSTVNEYLVEDVLAARDSAAWGDPTKRAQAVQQAVTKAKARAAKDALGLAEGDIRERIERERSRKAG